MNTKQYLQFSGIVFSLVCLAHLTRVIKGTSLSIGSWDAPMSLSYVALALAGFLAYSAWKLR